MSPASLTDAGVFQRGRQNVRRIVVRYERVAKNFLGMLQLACSLILLRGL